MNCTSRTYNVAVGEVRSLANTVYQNVKTNCYQYLSTYSGGSETLGGTRHSDGK